MIVPERVDNLYVIGRCASMTHGGQSSARVTGPCFAMGEAAGTAVDLALASAVAGADVDVAELQRRLERGGAYLGRDTCASRSIAASPRARSARPRRPGN
jgi:hypothetical protein